MSVQNIIMVDEIYVKELQSLLKQMVHFFTFSFKLFRISSFDDWRYRYVLYPSFCCKSQWNNLVCSFFGSSPYQIVSLTRQNNAIRIHWNVGSMYNFMCSTVAPGKVFTYVETIPTPLFIAWLRIFFNIESPATDRVGFLGLSDFGFSNWADLVPADDFTWFTR